MPKYNDKFTLDMHDVELIEQALRVLWSEDEKNLLGKISNQKIYYSEVNRTSCPIG
jgi:hypothetical protein